LTRSALAADSCPALLPDEINAPATHVILLNGIWTSFADARADMNALRTNYGSTGPDGENLRYALLYHQSAVPEAMAELADGFGALLADAEGGVLEGHFELFFSALHCGGPWWDYIVHAMPSFGTLLERDFAREVHAATADDMLALIDTPPEMDEFACAREQLRDWADSDLVFVGHSEGGLFARVLRDSLEGTNRQGDMASLHIAPPTAPPDDEPYLLADIDYVIRGILGARTDVPEPNVEAVTNTMQLGECLGHDLSDVYLTDFELNRAVRDTLDQILP
jgi:hypothetical protein